MVYSLYQKFFLFFSQIFYVGQNNLIQNLTISNMKQLKQIQIHFTEVFKK